MLRRPLLVASIATLFAATFAQAEVAPYVGDEPGTLHLWHLNESSAPALNSISGGTSLQGLLNNATLNHTSYDGFGTALSTNSGTGTPNTTGWKGGILLAQPSLADGSGDNVASPFVYTGAGGEFAFEAIIRFDVAPGSADANLKMVIMSMDDDNTPGSRVFTFRLDDLASPNLEFVNFNTTTQTLSLALPTTGPNALSVGDWYHAAVSYNGLANTADNLSFFWTKLGEEVTTANLLGSLQMTRDLTGARGDFAIGNEARSTGEAENFPGLIDEVRISDTARGADDFIFAVPEPSTGLLAAFAGLTMLGRRRRDSRA